MTRMNEFGGKDARMVLCCRMLISRAWKPAEAFDFSFARLCRRRTV